MNLPKINFSRRSLLLTRVLLIVLAIPATLALIRVSQELRRRAAPPSLPKATIKGIAFEDIDGNSMLSEGEPGFSGVIVILKDGGGNYLSEIVADTKGYFEFADLDPGDYAVEEIVPNGYKNTTPTSAEINGLEGSQEREVSFGSRSVPPPGKGRISGYKWDDQNANGVWDTGELPYTERLVITLSGVSSDTDLADEIGYFEFGDLEPGNYAVEETPPDDWRPTTPVSVAVTLATGGDETVNFGNVRISSTSTSTATSTKAKIFGYKFNDVNGNGSWDVPSEPGIGKVAITLKDGGGATLSSTETVEGTNLGYYLFENLEPGTYIVEETAESFEVTLRAGEAKQINF